MLQINLKYTKKLRPTLSQENLTVETQMIFSLIQIRKIREVTFIRV